MMEIAEGDYVVDVMARDPRIGRVVSIFSGGMQASVAITPKDSPVLVMGIKRLMRVDLVRAIKDMGLSE